MHFIQSASTLKSGDTGPILNIWQREMKVIQVNIIHRIFRKYVVWQKINKTYFLLTMNFILFTNQSYPFQNSSLAQLHSDGGVVSIFRSSAARHLLLYIPFSSSVTLYWILSKVPKWRPFKWFLSRGIKRNNRD